MISTQKKKIIGNPGGEGGKRPIVSVSGKGEKIKTAVETKNIGGGRMVVSN